MNDTTRLTFDFNWKLTLGVVLLLPLLIRLCFWQLARAEEKEQLSRAWQSQQQQLPQPFDAQAHYDDFRRVTLSGRFSTEHYWLLENQAFNGQLGYLVVMPFRLDSGVEIAVDRGWVAGSPHRDFVPRFDTPQTSLRITGTLVTPSDSKLIRESEVSARVWPHKILEVDLAVMSSQSGKRFYPKLLKLDADSPAALQVQWTPINMSPAKHYGYAFQWGAMALALVLAYGFASTNVVVYLRAKFR